MELSQEQKCLEEVHEEIKKIKLLIDKNDDFKRIIESPMLSRSEIKDLVTDILKNMYISNLLVNFFSVVCLNRRSYLIGKICNHFLEMYIINKGILTAELVSANALGEKNLKLVKKNIQKKAGSEINLITKVDPSILGGYVLKIGSLMLDGSIRSKLQSLKTSMRKG